MRDNRACRTSATGHGLRTGPVSRKAVLAPGSTAAVLRPVAAAAGTGQQPGRRPGSPGDFWAVLSGNVFHRGGDHGSSGRTAGE